MSEAGAPRHLPHPLRWARGLLEASAEIPAEALRFLGTSHRWRRRAPPAGAHPGTFVVPPEAPRPRIAALIYGPEACEERRIERVEELAEIVADARRVAWIDVQGFGDPSLLERIREVLGVHPLAMADVVNVPQRPKAELYDGRLLIVTQMARLASDGGIEIDQLSLILGPSWVATFQEQHGDVFGPVRERIHTAGSRIRQQGPDYLAYALLDAVMDGYFPVVEAIGEVIEALEEEVMREPTRATLARIHATRRMLTHLHRIQWRQRDALGSLLRDEESPFAPSVRPYLRDAHDHVFQTLDVIENFRDMSVGLMDVYLSAASNRMNDVMKTLTVMASIFIPLTFVAGVYGMNFEYMPELRWRWGYPAVWLGMTALAGGLVLWFRRRGWLDSAAARDGAD